MALVDERYTQIAVTTRVNQYFCGSNSSYPTLGVRVTSHLGWMRQVPSKDIFKYV